MRIKADWTTYLHGIRTREFHALFGRCPDGAIDEALELGAGDGFVSTLLADKCGKLVATDFNADRLSHCQREGVTYQTCDAEAVGEHFDEGRFDLVFSSNLLEHLPDCARALRGIHRVLTDDGITVHCVPNRWWKLATLLLHVPNKSAKFVDRVLGGKLFHRAKRPRGGGSASTRNNPKIRRRRRFFLAKLLVPRIHGVSRTTVREFIAFGRKRWLRRFESAGFRVLAVRKIGFNSGYGFGCDRLRRLMDRLGIHTCDAYIACKQGADKAIGERFQWLGHGRRASSQ